jgi:hypothetical protein
VVLADDKEAWQNWQVAMFPSFLKYNHTHETFSLFLFVLFLGETPA